MVWRSLKLRIDPRAKILPLVLAAILVAAPVGGPKAQSGGGYTLDQAVAAARQSTGGKVTKATTRTSNGREVHEIRVLTKDNRVRTLRYPGKRADGDGS
jgi:hypothetical protein